MISLRAKTLLVTGPSAKPSPWSRDSPPVSMATARDIICSRLETSNKRWKRLLTPAATLQKKKKKEKKGCGCRDSARCRSTRWAAAPPFRMEKFILDPSAPSQWKEENHCCIMRPQAPHRIVVQSVFCSDSVSLCGYFVSLCGCWPFIICLALMSVAGEGPLTLWAPDTELPLLLMRNEMNQSAWWGRGNTPETRNVFVSRLIQSFHPLLIEIV